MMIAPGALKRAEVEPHACGHDASEHHVGVALWAGGAMGINVDGIGQGTGFRHDASLNKAGAQHSLSPVMCLVKVRRCSQHFALSSISPVNIEQFRKIAEHAQRGFAAKIGFFDKLTLVLVASDAVRLALDRSQSVKVVLTAQ
jgi:hypothetical protein